VEQIVEAVGPLTNPPPTAKDKRPSRRAAR
jgi:hypothetical protein